MRVADELGPKLPEIRRWAMELFANMELRPYGLHFDDNGAVAFDRANPMNQPHMGNQPWTEEDQQRLIAVVRDKVTRFYEELEALLAAFRVYFDLDTLDFTVMAGTLGGQRGQVGGEPTNVHARIGYAESYWVTPIDGLINGQDWFGDAASTFERQLLRPFRDAVVLQQGYVTELSLVAQSYREYMFKMRDALLAVADECIDALGGPARITTGELTAPIHALSITSIVAGVLSFFPPIAVAAGGVSLGAGFVSYVAPLIADPVDGPPINEVHGDTVWDVLRLTREALASMERFIGDGDDKLSAALDAAMNSTQSLGHPGLVVEPPDAADGPGRASFNTLNVQSVAGVPLSQDKVVVSIVDLYRAGKVNLAGAAAQYAEASKELGAITTPPSLARFFPRSVGKFHEARKLLIGILDRTRETLERSGEALMQIATNYQLSDEKAGEVLRQVNGLVTPSPNPEPSRLGGV